MNIQADVDTLKQARPYLRALLAFAFRLRYGGSPHLWTTVRCYSEAEEFIQTLIVDVKNKGTK